MMLDDKTLATLQKIGLTYYGAKAYYALVALGPSSASLIAEEAEIPRSKVYEVLRRLTEEGWARVERGRPLKYSALYPRDVIEARKGSLYSDVDYASSELSRIYDQHEEKEAPRVWLIRGMDNITVKSLDMMARARHSVMLLGALYSVREIEQLKKEMVRLSKKGVNVRVISRPEIRLKEGEFNIVDAFAGVAEVRTVKTPYLKFIVIDGREILIMFSKVEDEMPELENVIALWIPNPAVATLMASNFNMIWNS